MRNPFICRVCGAKKILPFGLCWKCDMWKSEIERENKQKIMEKREAARRELRRTAFGKRSWES